MDMFTTYKDDTASEAAARQDIQAPRRTSRDTCWAGVAVEALGHTAKGSSLEDAQARNSASDVPYGRSSKCDDGWWADGWVSTGWRPCGVVS
jgi:hypothetical protein